jgi:hypothetical protein
MSATYTNSTFFYRRVFQGSKADFINRILDTKVKSDGQMGRNTWVLSMLGRCYYKPNKLVLSALGRCY